MSKSHNLRYSILIVVLTSVLVAAFSLSGGSPLSEASPSESATLLIVAHEDFLDELQPLVEWKSRTGMPTILVSWQTLDGDYTGSDVPERIKRGIADFEQRFGIEYVMLVGDSHNFPVRYQITDRIERTEQQVELAMGAYYACDLYYADLYDESGNFDSWDFDGDDYFGELWGEYFQDHINQDRIDMIPDVAVGRVPASNEDEITNYVNKVLHYEFSLISDTETWISNVLFEITADEFPAFYTAKENTIVDYTGITFLNNKPQPTFWRMYSPEVSSTTDYLPDVTTIINLMNNEGVGLFNFGGHGGQADEMTEQQYWCTMSGGLGTWDFQFLTTQRYSIVFSTGCGNGRFAVEPPYDAYVDEFRGNHPGTDNGEVFSTSSYPPRPDPLQPIIPPGGLGEVDSFGEWGLVRTEFRAGTTIVDISDRGFIAFIGCVTGAQDPIGELDEYFLQAFFSWHGLEKRLGDVWNYAIEMYCDENSYGRGEYSETAGSWVDVAAYHMPIKVNLFGDPSLRVGGLPHYPPTLLVVLGSPDPIPEGTTFHYSPYLMYTDVEESGPQYRIDWNGDDLWDTDWGGDDYRYNDDFEGNARIQASDGEYFSEVVEVSLSVYNVDPEPTITPPVVDIEEDLSYSYTFNPGDPGFDEWEYTIDFGDGTVITEHSDSAVSVSHEYDSAGEYTIQVTVLDDDGGTGSASETVNVAPPGRMGWFWRRITELGGGSDIIGIAIIGIINLAGIGLSVTAWVKIPKWWRGCPMAARVIITLLPILAVIGIMILLGIIPPQEYVRLP